MSELAVAEIRYYYPLLGSFIEHMFIFRFILNFCPRYIDRSGVINATGNMNW